MFSNNEGLSFDMYSAVLDRSRSRMLSRVLEYWIDKTSTKTKRECVFLCT